MASASVLIAIASSATANGTAKMVGSAVISEVSGMTATGRYKYDPLPVDPASWDDLSVDSAVWAVKPVDSATWTNL